MALPPVASNGWGSAQVIVPLVLGFITVIDPSGTNQKWTKPFLDMSVFKSKQFTLTTILVSLAMMASDWCGNGVANLYAKYSWVNATTLWFDFVTRGLDDGD